MWTSESDNGWMAEGPYGVCKPKDKCDKHRCEDCGYYDCKETEKCMWTSESDNGWMAEGPYGVCKPKDQQDQPSATPDNQANDSSDNPSPPPVSTPAAPPTTQSTGSNNTTIPSDSAASLFNYLQMMDRNIISEAGTP